MARVTHTLQSLNAKYSTTGKNLTLVAATPADDEEVVMVDNMVIVATNTHATDAGTVTVTSTALNGRTGDVAAHSIVAGGITIFGPFPTAGWAQTNGKLYFEASAATIKFACVRLPNN